MPKEATQVVSVSRVENVTDIELTVLLYVLTGDLKGVSAALYFRKYLDRYGFAVIILHIRA